MLSEKYGLPYEVIRVICNSPFKFASRVMQDDDDERQLMFAYLGKMKLKNRFKGKKNEKQK